MINLNAVLFDLDGLVIDSESTYFMAWKAAAEQLNYRIPDNFWPSLSGCSASQLYQQLAAQLGPSEFDRDQFSQTSSQYWQQHVEQQGIPIKRGFLPLLEILKQRTIPYALVTNSNRANAKRALALAGLADVFAVMVCGDEVTQPKPAACGYLQAATQLGVDPHACLILEDSLVGIKAGRAAGAYCGYVPSQTPLDADASALAHWTFTDLSQAAHALFEAPRLSL